MPLRTDQIPTDRQQRQHKTLTIGNSCFPLMQRPSVSVASMGNSGRGKSSYVTLDGSMRAPSLYESAHGLLETGKLPLVLQTLTSSAAQT